MNEQQIDKLFQSKLSGYTKAPSKRALEKFEEKIYDRRRASWNRFGRIAAAILLIAMSIGIINQWDSSEEITVTPVPEVQPSVTPVSPPLVAETESPESNSTIDLDPVAQQTEPIEQTIVASNQPGPNPLPQNQEVNSTSPTETKKSNKEQTITESKQPVSTIAENNKGIDEPRKRKVTITYKRAANTEPRHAETLATTEKRNKNAVLKSFWKKAVRVNQQNISLAGIRATKEPQARGNNWLSQIYRQMIQGKWL